MMRIIKSKLLEGGPTPEQFELWDDRKQDEYLDQHPHSQYQHLKDIPDTDRVAKIKQNIETLRRELHKINGDLEYEQYRSVAGGSSAEIRDNELTKKRNIAYYKRLKQSIENQIKSYEDQLKTPGSGS